VFVPAQEEVIDWRLVTGATMERVQEANLLPSRRGCGERTS